MILVIIWLLDGQGVLVEAVVLVTEVTTEVIEFEVNVFQTK